MRTPPLNNPEMIVCKQRDTPYETSIAPEAVRFRSGIPGRPQGPGSTLLLGRGDAQLGDQLLGRLQLGLKP